MASHFIVGLDIGTASIKTVVAERQKDGKPRVVLAFQEPIAGVRKGIVVDLAEASQGVANVLSEIKKISRYALSNIFVNIGTHHIKTQSSQGISAISRADTEIYQDDIERVLRASQAVSVGSNRKIIHNITREFIVDGVGDITDPLGLSGSRLEVNSLIIDAFTPHVKSLDRVVELCGGRVERSVLSSLAASRAVLSKTQKDLGVVLLDIGAGTTGIAVYEENKLLGVSVLPMGAANITNDIAVGLKIPVAAAEEVKLRYGYAVAKEISAKESIDLAKLIPGVEGVISRRYLAQIIECRLAEIFEFVNNELKLLGKARQLPGGAVLVGGGAKLPGITELVRQELKLASQLGASLSSEWSEEQSEYKDIFEDPEYTSSLGLVLLGADHKRWLPKEKQARLRVKNIIRHFLP